MTHARHGVVSLPVLAACVLIGLGVAGTGSLAAPPVGSWSAFEDWYDRVGAATASVVAVRLLAMLGAGWLLIATALQVVASLSLPGRLQRVADAVSQPVLRRLTGGIARLSVTAGLTVPTVVVAPLTDPPGTAVMQVLDDADEATTSTTAPPTTTTSTPPVIAAPAVPVPAPTPKPTDDEVVVQAGDSFWKLALDIVAETRGIQPSDSDVAPYWRQLIDANRARLVDAGNPDLLLPGQRLTIPPP